MFIVKAHKFALISLLPKSIFMKLGVVVFYCLP